MFGNTFLVSFIRLLSLLAYLFKNRSSWILSTHRAVIVFYAGLKGSNTFMLFNSTFQTISYSGNDVFKQKLLTAVGFAIILGAYVSRSFCSAIRFLSLLVENRAVGFCLFTELLFVFYAGPKGSNTFMRFNLSITFLQWQRCSQANTCLLPSGLQSVLGHTFLVSFCSAIRFLSLRFENKAVGFCLLTELLLVFMLVWKDPILLCVSIPPFNNFLTVTTMLLSKH